MGSFESRISNSPPASFTASETVPGKVRFTNELLTQLQREQEVKFQQSHKRTSLGFVQSEDELEAENERLRKLLAEIDILKLKSQDYEEARSSETNLFKYVDQQLDVSSY